MATVAQRRVGAEVGASRGRWLAPCLALGAVLAAMAVAFRTEAAAAVTTWDDSTAYNHCWLVLPVALWLGWERRRRLAKLCPAPSPLLALLVLPLAVLWLAAERLGIMEGRQLAALGMAEAAALGILGWPVCRAFAGPLVYLVFLVPFGTFAVPALQHVTARIVVIGLHLLNISVYADDLIIQIPEGTFYVAEACAGLRFEIAALAFGALYAVTMFRSPTRRLVVMVLAATVPIVANGLRALGIVVLGHVLGSAQAAAADHLVYGWGFFSAVILLLTLAGLPFRQDGAQADGGTGQNSPGLTSLVRVPMLLLATAVAAGCAIVGPAVAAGLTGSGAPESLPVALAPPEGCRPAASDPVALQCGEAVLTARLLVFSPRSTWANVAAARNRAEGTDDEAETFRATTGGGEGEWHGRQRERAVTAAATAAWLDGQPAGDGLRSRLKQALNSIGLGTGRPVVAVVELRPADEGAAAPAQSGLLLAVLRLQTSLAADAARRSREESR